MTVKLLGVSPLLLHNGQLADPLCPIVQEIKKISGKRKKTDADYEEMARLEWYGGLYLDKDEQIIIPGINIEAVLIKAAKTQKSGPTAKAGVFIEENPVLIHYRPIDLRDLSFNQHGFVGIRISIGKQFGNCYAAFDRLNRNLLLVYGRFHSMRNFFRLFAGRGQRFIVRNLINKIDRLKCSLQILAFKVFHRKATCSAK